MKPSESTAQLEALVSVRDAAGILGLSEQSIYRFMRTRELVPVRIGGRTLFEPAELRRFIAERRVTPAAGDAP